MPFAVEDGADSASVAAASHHAQVAGLELYEVHDLVGVDVEAERIVDLRMEGSVERQLFIKIF
jgi:hypothetical protein